MKNIQYLNLILGLILAGVLSRLIPHVPNFTAVGATALFAGAVLRPKWLAFILLLFILWLSDLFLNNGMYKNMYPENYKGWQWMGSVWVYGSFLIITLLGQLLIQKVKFKSVLLASVSASMVFFLITNFAVWINNPKWPQTIAGLVGCYTFAIPYFWNTLAGDLVFSGMIFGIYSWAITKKPFLQKTV